MATTAAVLAAASYAYAQQAEEPGLRLTFDVGTGISVTENAGLNDPSLGTTTEADTTLGFGILSETRTERFEANIATALTYRKEPNADGEFDVDSPEIGLSYAREGADSLLTFGGRFARERLDDTTLTFFDENLEPVDLLIDTGELRRRSLDARLAVGIEAPLGFDVSLRYDDRDYIDTLDPDLYDRTTISVDTVTSLRFSDVLTGRITASASQFDADDIVQTEETTTRLGVGATYEISPALRASADVSYTRIETTEGGVDAGTTEGFGFGLSATQDLSNGAITGSVSRSVTVASERTQIGFDRAMELPRGSLSFGLSYSFADDGDDTLLARLAFSQEMRTGRLTASLSQDTRSDDDDNDVRFTRLAVGYDYEINSLSSLGVDFGLGRSEDIGDGLSDTVTRADFDVVYRRELTRDWDWSLGYRARYVDDESGDTATSNMVYTRIDRSFSLRP